MKGLNDGICTNDDAAGVDHYDEDCVTWSAVMGEAGYVNTVIEPS